jgi:endoglucanase
MYTPYNFAMGVPGDRNFTSSHKNELNNIFNKINNKYLSKGIPVVIGEMGATNKENLKHRAAWFGYFIQHSRKYGMTACVWDNGSWNVSDGKYEEKYGYYNRTKQEWYFPLLMEVALKASEIK